MQSLPSGAPREASEPVVEATPPAGRVLFGDSLAVAEEYGRLLVTAGVQRGLIGPREAPRLWERHLLNCAVLAELVPGSADVVDLGSGAGLPGLVLAILRPGAAFTLLEPMAKRVTFLSECIESLGLGNVRVVRARAEEVAGTMAADMVTARAVAPLDRLAGWSLPLLRRGGTVLAMKGKGAGGELEQSLPVLRRLGARKIEVLRLGEGIVDPAATVVRFRAGRAPGATTREASKSPRPGNRPGPPARHSPAPPPG